MDIVIKFYNLALFVEIYFLINLPLFTTWKKLEKLQEIDLINCWKIRTNIGIQADPTGYGKTASIVGLLSRDKMKWPINEEFTKESIHIIGNGLQITQRKQYRRIKTSLIIIGQSLVSQWKDELSLSNIKFDIVKTRKHTINISVEEYDVILCTPTMYNKLVARYNCAWKRLIYDEPGTVQISCMKPIITGFTWFITATPDLLRWKYHSRRNHYISQLTFRCLNDSFFKLCKLRMI